MDFGTLSMTPFLRRYVNDYVKKDNLSVSHNRRDRGDPNRRGDSDSRSIDPPLLHPVVWGELGDLKEKDGIDRVSDSLPYTCITSSWWVTSSPKCIYSLLTNTTNENWSTSQTTVSARIKDERPCQYTNRTTSVSHSSTMHFYFYVK